MVKIMSEEELNKMYENIDRRVLMERLNGSKELSKDTQDKINLYNEVIRLSYELEKKTKILDELKEYTLKQINCSYEADQQCYEDILSTLEELEKSDK
jgi:hypothetical protein